MIKRGAISTSSKVGSTTAKVKEKRGFELSKSAAGNVCELLRAPLRTGPLSYLCQIVRHEMPAYLANPVPSFTPTRGRLQEMVFTGGV